MITAEKSESRQRIIRDLFKQLFAGKLLESTIFGPQLTCDLSPDDHESREMISQTIARVTPQLEEIEKQVNSLL